MRILPATKQDRYKLLLFPFEAYVVMVPIIAITLESILGYSRGVHRLIDQEVAQRYALLGYGYIGCITALLLGAAALRDRSARRAAIIFAALGLILGFLLLPATTVPRTRSATGSKDGNDAVVRAGVGPWAHAAMLAAVLEKRGDKWV